MHLSALRHRAVKLLVDLINDTYCIVVMKQMILHTNAINKHAVDLVKC